jgi:hypothetical protein
MGGVSCGWGVEVSTHVDEKGKKTRMQRKRIRGSPDEQSSICNGEPGMLATRD